MFKTFELEVAATEQLLGCNENRDKDHFLSVTMYMWK